MIGTFYRVPIFIYNISHLKTGTLIFNNYDQLSFVTNATI